MKSSGVALLFFALTCTSGAVAQDPLSTVESIIFDPIMAPIAAPLSNIAVGAINLPKAVDRFTSNTAQSIAGATKSIAAIRDSFGFIIGNASNTWGTKYDKGLLTVNYLSSGWMAFLNSNILPEVRNVAINSVNQVMNSWLIVALPVGIIICGVGLLILAINSTVYFYHLGYYRCTLCKKQTTP